MGISKRTIALVVTVALVGVLAVAMASVALGKQTAAPRVDPGDIAGIGEVVWGPAGSGHASSLETTPTISGVDPSVKAVGSAAFVMTVSGSSMVSTSTVLWNGGALSTVSQTGSSMTVNVPASRVADVALVNVTVSTGSKESTGTIPFKITQPTISSVTPTFTASAVTTATVTITGTFLKDGLDAPHLTLKGTGAIAGTTIDGTGVSATNETTMVGAFNLAVAPSGVYDVVLTYGATGLVTKAAAFTINNPVPTVTTISPTTVYAGSAQPLLLTVNGTGFSPGAGGSTIKMGAAALTTTFVSSTQLTAPLTMVATATAGNVAITVVNPTPGGGTSNAVNLTIASDTTKPVTSITGADSAWHNASVVLTVTATDAQSGVEKTQYDVDGGTPITLVGSTITVLADGTMEGANTVEAWSTDWCGNAESPRPQVTVNIDTVGPKTSGSAPDTVKTGRKAKATFKYRANDVTPKCDIVLKIKYKSSGKVARTYKLGNKVSGTSLKYTTKPNLAKGTYIFYVYATDQAGNKQSKLGTDTFKVK